MLSISLPSCPCFEGLLVGGGVGALRDLVRSLASGMYPHTTGRGRRGSELFFSQLSICNGNGNCSGDGSGDEGLWLWVSISSEK